MADNGLNLRAEFRDFLLLSTNESRAFATEIYDHLSRIVGSVNLDNEISEGVYEKRMGHVRGTYHNDGEPTAQIETNVRRKRVYYVHHFCGPDARFNVPHGESKLKRVDGAFGRSSPREVTYILPYLPYARSDRSTRARQPVSVKDFLRDLRNCDYLLTLDLHDPHIIEYVDHYRIIDIYADPVLEQAVRDLNLQNLAVVSPDAGGIPRARRFAKRLDAPLAFIDKRRERDGEVEEMHLVGDVRDKTVLIRDDMIDTAGTFKKAAKHLVDDWGAVDVYGVMTSGIYSASAVERIRESGAKIIATNNIPRGPKFLRANKDWLTQVSPAELIAQTIHQLHISDGSISGLQGKTDLIDDTWDPAK